MGSQEEKTTGRDAAIDHVRFLMIRELRRLDYNVKLMDKLTAMHDEIMCGDFRGGNNVTKNDTTAKNPA